jgi:hypothetical protein
MINRNNEIYFIDLSFKKEMYEGSIFDGEIKTIDNRLNILSYGINIYDDKGNGSEHAEANAIRKLQALYKKNYKKISILVIRTSITGKLGMSKPCIKCLLDLYNKPLKKGYIIKNVIYSDNNGNIVFTN